MRTWKTFEIASFVIVHGGWGGGWEWTEVARSLRERGHEVFTPTLTGMGERAHLGHPQVGLSAHVEDVVAVLELEDLDNLVLCGHSYVGMPVTGAADRAIDRIGLVIYIDALVPRHGQSAFDLLPGSFRQQAHTSADSVGDGWRVPIPAAVLPPEGWVTNEKRARYVARLRDQPLATFAEPLHLTGAIASVSRAFVRCTGDELGREIGGDPIAPLAARARDEGWLYLELVAPHDPQLTDPVGTATALHNLTVAAGIGPDRR
jgi:pimeloyl-ACP methyl ester carboxylesterase